MIILGLDLATNSGWATFDARSRVVLKTGLIRLDADGYYAKRRLFEAMFEGLLRANGKPDFVVFEEPEHASRQGIAATITPWHCCIAPMASVLDRWGVPYAPVNLATWRSRMFRNRHIPLKKPTKSQPNPTKDWKKAAIQLCDEWGIPLPSPASLADNAAEAALLVQCWRHCKPAETGVWREFMALESQLGARAA